MQNTHLSAPGSRGGRIGGIYRRRSVKFSLLAGVFACGLAAGLFGAPQFSPPAALAETAPMGSTPTSFADVIEVVKPSVVSVLVKTSIEAPTVRLYGRGEFFPDLPDGHPLERFFRRFGDEEFDNRRPERPREDVFGSGSGFIISDDGFIVTNHHVVDKAASVTVRLENGDEYEAEVVGADTRTDLALLKVDAGKSLPFAKFATKDVRVGDWVIAIGNPFGFFGNSVTAGIVSARERDSIGALGGRSRLLNDFIQIDAAVNKGNSGGPAFNLNGEVIGVNTAIFSPSGGNVGIAFAIPAHTVRDVVDQLRQNGSVTRGWLGVRIQSVTRDIAESIGLETAKGALVADVESESPAAKAGVQIQDTIISVNGDAVDSSKDLARKIASLAPGSDARLTVWRAGGEKMLTVKLGTLPVEQKASPPRAVPTPSPKATIAQLGITLRRDSETDQLVIVDVARNSKVAQKGVRRGDVIAGVSGESVKTLADVEAAIREAQNQGRKAVLVRLKSGDAIRFVALNIEEEK